MIDPRAYDDIQTGNAPHALDLDAEGIPGSALRAGQLLILQQLIETYLSNMPPMLAKAPARAVPASRPA